MALFKALRGDSSRISTDITPFHDGYAYLTTDDGGFYIDAATSSGNQRIRINPKDRNVTCTLLATGWSGGSQTVAVDGLGAEQNGEASLPQNISAEALSAARAALLRVTGQAAGSITITAEGETPTVDIPILVVIYE